MPATLRPIGNSLTPSKAKLLCIDPARVAEIWPHVRGLLKRASEKTGTGDFAQQEREVLTGLQLLWIAWNGEAIEAACTTQLVNENGVKICVLVACGGHNRARWLPLLAGIEDYARIEGCTRMQIIGRKGWSRVLDGYEARYVVLCKELDG